MEFHTIVGEYPIRFVLGETSKLQFYYQLFQLWSVLRINLRMERYDCKEYDNNYYAKNKRR